MHFLHEMVRRLPESVILILDLDFGVRKWPLCFESRGQLEWQRPRVCMRMGEGEKCRRCGVR